MKQSVVRSVLTIALIIGRSCLGTCEAQDQSSNPSTYLPNDGVGFIHDVEVGRQAEKQVNQMIKDDQGTKCSELFAQLDRSSHRVQLIRPTRKSQPLPKHYVQACKSIVLVMISRKHNDHWHINPAATGFVIAQEGIVATNYHVVLDNDEYMFVMSFDGQVHPVVEVLAGNEASDAVLLRIATDALPPLALKVKTPVGAEIRVISHPKGRFYSLSKGIVSRRYIRPPRKRRPQEDQDEDQPQDPSSETRWVTVSAEFGSGSSGAPVMDRFGNVIAMATSTNGVEAGEGEAKTTQMVFRDCVPAEAILGMIKRPTDR